MAETRSVTDFGKDTLRRFAGRPEFPQPPFIRTRHPVVLMHGFGMLASLRRGGHMHDQAMYLRSRGVRAFAPNVSPYHTIPFRAAMWKDRIERILNETGADAVNLVAHSMGGLDARYLIRELDMHGHVASLVTVSTPHRGSALADLVREQPERVRSWMTDAAHWVSDATMKDMPSDFSQAVEDLTPAHVTGVFNPAVTDHPDVLYWSWAGVAGKGASVPVNPLLRLLNMLLYAREGLNDGFVSLESAKWGQFQGRLDADHAQQIGIGKSIGSRFDANEFYADVAFRLGEAGC